MLSRIMGNCFGRKPHQYVLTATNGKCNSNGCDETHGLFTTPQYLYCYRHLQDIHRKTAQCNYVEHKGMGEECEITTNLHETKDHQFHCTRHICAARKCENDTHNDKAKRLDPEAKEQRVNHLHYCDTHVEAAQKKYRDYKGEEIIMKGYNNNIFSLWTGNEEARQSICKKLRKQAGEETKEQFQQIAIHLLAAGTMRMNCRNQSRQHLATSHMTKCLCASLRPRLNS